MARRNCQDWFDFLEFLNLLEFWVFGCLDVWTGELGYVNEGERRERAQSVHFDVWARNGYINKVLSEKGETRVYTRI